MNKSLFFLLVLSSLIFSSLHKAVAQNTVSYTSGVSLYIGVPVSLSPTTTGSTPTGYSISGTLTGGLSFNTTTGVISGTPTQNSYYSSYTITASFVAGGSATFSFSYFVDGANYYASSYSFPQGTLIKDPQYGGSTLNSNMYKHSTLNSVTVYPALPAGLTLDPATGNITGTPTVVTAAANYTIYANFTSSTGVVVSSPTVLNITITGPTLVYSASSYYFYVGSSISMPVPTASGTPSSFSISPTTITSNGSDYLGYQGNVIGTPTASQVTTPYTFTANYSNGTTATANVNITVDGISYTGSPYSIQEGSAMNPASPTVVGETPANYSISSGTLPSGLSFNTTTGVISGQPTTVTNQSLTIKANYSSGGSTTTNVQINTSVQYLSYNTPNTYIQGTAITPLTPTVTNDPQYDTPTYTVSPALPTGLTLNANGSISGTPTGVASNANYVVTGTFNYGNNKASFVINIIIDGTIYSGSPYIFYQGKAITTVTPTLIGTPTAYAISSNFTTNTGLSFSTSTGAISGTPTTLSAAQPYTVTATYGTSGSTTTAVSVAVLAPPTLSYTSFPATIYEGSSISQSPTVAGTPNSGATYSVSPALPAGLTINPTTGVISGYSTSTTPVASAVYTISFQYASGTANVATTTINFAIAAPTLTYTATGNYYTGTVITSLTPGGNGTASSYSISASSGTLTSNTGLSFNTTTGVISGTPTTPSSPAVTYTITANYNGVTTKTASTLITVNGITYAGSPFNYTLGTPVTAASPTVTATGTPTSYSISPNLSTTTGLTFNTTTGGISGTPAIATSGFATYTVSAVFAGGTATTTIAIDIIAPGYVWTGSGTNTNWSNTVNWNPAVVPTSSTAAIIPNTGNLPTVDVASSCNSLSVTGNTTITLSAALTVTNGLTVSGGNLTFAGTKSATFGGASTISGTYAVNIGSLSTINFNSTTLNLANGNTGSNTVAIANAGTLNLTSTTLTEGTNLSINNTGALNLSAATVVLANAVSSFTSPAYNTNVTGGTVNYSLKNSGTVTANNSSVFTFNDVGTIYNSGTFIAGTSGSATTLNLSGNGSAIVNAGTFLIGSTSVINLTASSYNYGPGTASASVTNNSGNIFALMSDNNGSATIGQITNSGTFSGNFYVQRYLPSASAGGYRLLSTPVFGGASTSPAANYANLTYLNTTTPSINGITYPGAATGGPTGFTITNANPTMFLYDEAIIPETGTQQNFFNGKYAGLTQLSSSTVSYKNLKLTPTTGTASVYAGTGLTFYDIGPSTTYSTHGAINATTISYYGQINQSNIKFYNPFAPTGNLSYTTGTTYVGYNLVGNPYASTIDLNKLAADNFTSGTIKFYELTDGQSFCAWTYNATTGTGSSDGTSVQYINSGQAFFILATGTGQSLTFKEDQKVNTAVPAGFLAAPANQTISANTLASINRSASVTETNQGQYTGLHLMLAKDSSTFKTCGVFFSESGTDNLDDADAKDLDGINPTIYLSSYTADGERTSINAMSGYLAGKNVKLYVNSATAGSFKMNLMDMANVDTTAFNIYLVDNYKKDTVNIGQNRTYIFNILLSDTTTFGGNRFVLAIQPRVVHYKLLAFNGVKSANSVALTWKTNNEGAYTNFGVQKYDAASKAFKTIDSLQSNGGGIYNYVDKNPAKGTNTYRLAQKSIDGSFAYSNALVITYNADGILSVYPNPAVDVVTVNLTSVTSSTTQTYDITIYNSMGVKVMQQSVSGDAASQNVSALKPGVYLVDVKSKYGNSIGSAKFFKN